MMGLPSDLASSLRPFLQGKNSAADSLHKRSADRGDLLRLPFRNSTAVIKVWKIRNLKERLKSILHLSNGSKEWRMHRLIFKAGIEVPEPLAFHRLTVQTGQAYEVMAMEDLGAVQRGLPYMKKLLKTGDDIGISGLEEHLIEVTAAFIKAHFLDIDHQLNNFVVDARGRLMRIDFECARHNVLRITSKSELSEMLARLIASHVYAVQPEVFRSVYFAEHLFQKLDIDRPIRALVSASVNAKLEKQRNREGVATSVALPV